VHFRSKSFKKIVFELFLERIGDFSWILLAILERFLGIFERILDEFGEDFW